MGVIYLFLFENDKQTFLWFILIRTNNEHSVMLI